MAKNQAGCLCFQKTNKIHFPLRATDPQDEIEPDDHIANSFLDIATDCGAVLHKYR